MLMYVADRVFSMLFYFVFCIFFFGCYDLFTLIRLTSRLI